MNATEAGRPGASDAGFSDALISIRVVDIDSYQMPLDHYSPAVAFQAARLNTVESPVLPTVRIFGSTPAGQKACLHLHGLRPYLFVRLPEGVPHGNAVAFSQDLRAVLEKALAKSVSDGVTSNGATIGDVGGAAFPNAGGPFISDIEPTIRTSIYGFHPLPTIFLRISLYNPSMVRRLALILSLRQGLGNMGDFDFQPYESNISFILQVLTDLSLTGMGYINLSSAKFRLPLPMPLEKEMKGVDLAKVPPKLRVFTTSLATSRPDLFWKFGAAARRAKCDVELDAFVEDVLNPVDSLHRVHGQGGGPEAFAAKTLRILWDEERKRIGRTPTVFTEPPRAVLAGPALSAPRLREKLRSLLTGQSVSRADVAANQGSCEDVMQYLDSNIDGPRAAVRPSLDAELDAGMYSDESEVDVENDLNYNEWEDIRRTQVEGLDENLLNSESRQLPEVSAPAVVPDGCGELPGRPVSKRDENESQKSYDCDVHIGAQNAIASATDSRNSLPGRKQLREKACSLAHDLSLRYDDVCLEASRNVAGKRNTEQDIGSGHLGLSRVDVESGDEGIVERELALIDNGVNQHCRASLGNGDEIVEPDAHFLSDRNPRQEALLGSDNEGADEIMSFRSDERSALIVSGSDVAETSLVTRKPQVRFVENSSVLDNAGHGASPSSSLKAKRVSDNEQSWQILRPLCGPPDVGEVSAQFGAGCLLPRVCNVRPYYGNPADAPPKALVVGGCEIPIGVGGLSGLPRADDVFSSGGAAEVERSIYILVPTRKPPSEEDVVANVEESAPFRDGSTSRKRDQLKRTVIDSAGRQVRQGVAAAEGPEEILELTSFSWSAKDSSSRRVRRRVDDGCDHDSDSSSSPSDASVDELPLSVGSIGRARVQGRVFIPSVSRPASPKYDERSFFAADAWPKASGARTQKSTESPVLPEETEEAKTASLNPGDRGGCAGSAADVRASDDQHQGLTLAVIELLASSHGHRLPDPRKDSVLAVCVHTRDERIMRPEYRDRSQLLALQSVASNSTLRCDVTAFEGEASLFDGIVRLLDDFDPDILLGFETQTQSIGYLLDRADTLGIPLLRSLSRIVHKKFHGFAGARMKEGAPLSEMSAGARYFQRKGADIRIPGRHVLNVWRAVRTDVKLSSYTVYGVASEVLAISVPEHKPYVLEQWLASKVRADRALLHLCDLTRVCLAIVDKLDIVGRTGELARVYGIDFMSVLTRGSQYRVESMLARVAHQRDFLLLAAQRSQVYEQPAIECLPLVMEPDSGFYHDPVVVLDFQSLYPSVIIAHNLCYSTMLGNLNRLSSWSDAQQLGVVSDFRTPSPEDLRATFKSDCMDGIYVAPNGEMFVTAKYRRGILPQMLQEVLDTRVMVKTAMKTIACEPGENEELLKRLNARQFATKLLANVTYGFTSASASGRMPCAGLADAIVQGGRDSLEQIVRFVEDVLTPESGARVLYGDTDSLFVLVPGATKSEAFALGRRITEKAAKLFPAPMKLQLEKVYMSCFMVTKKRYVGYSFDSESCVTPAFDAKGVECVRRDSCAVVQKTMEMMVRTMFETRNVSQVKRVFQRCCQRIQRGSLPLSDFIFRKEVRLGTYKELPAAAVVATRAVESDPRSAPRSGERVSYVVRYCGPKAALKDCVVSPLEFLEAESKGISRLNSTYYISKQLVPALSRLFTLAGVNVRYWLAELPKISFPAVATKSASTIPFYFPSWTSCIGCGSRCIHELSVCDSCVRSAEKLQECFYLLNLRQRRTEIRRKSLTAKCMFCVGRTERDAGNIKCVSLDCSVRFAKDRISLRDKRVALDKLSKQLDTL